VLWRSAGRNKINYDFRDELVGLTA
jgi:hypothetical protein